MEKEIKQLMEENSKIKYREKTTEEMKEKIKELKELVYINIKRGFTKGLLKRGYYC